MIIESWLVMESYLVLFTGYRTVTGCLPEYFPYRFSIGGPEQEKMPKHPAANIMNTENKGLVSESDFMG
jgi:hypothetical protein